MHGTILAKVENTPGFQIVDRVLDSREVLLPDRHPGGLENIAVSPLTLAQFRLCPFPLGDVLEDAEYAFRPSLAVSCLSALSVHYPTSAPVLPHPAPHDS